MRLAQLVCLITGIFIVALFTSSIQLGCSEQQAADFQKTHDMQALGTATAKLPQEAVQAVAGNPAPLVSGLFDIGKILLGGTGGAAAATAISKRSRNGKRERRTDPPPTPTPTPPTAAPPALAAATTLTPLKAA